MCRPNALYLALILAFGYRTAHGENEVAPDFGFCKNSYNQYQPQGSCGSYYKASCGEKACCSPKDAQGGKELRCSYTIWDFGLSGACIQSRCDELKTCQQAGAQCAPNYYTESKDVSGYGQRTSDCCSPENAGGQILECKTLRTVYTHGGSYGDNRCVSVGIVQPPTTTTTTTTTTPAPKPQLFQMSGMSSGRCASVVPANAENNNPILLGDCVGGVNQLWSLFPVSTPIDHYYLKVGVEGHKKCLTVDNALTTNNAIVNQYDCWDGAGNQLWKLPVVNNNQSTVTLMNYSSGRCLTVLSAGTQVGAQLNIYDCKQAGNQIWILKWQ